MNCSKGIARSASGKAAGASCEPRVVLAGRGRFHDGLTESRRVSAHPKGRVRAENRRIVVPSICVVEEDNSF